jgi:hypothetical protein
MLQAYNVLRGMAAIAAIFILAQMMHGGHSHGLYKILPTRRRDDVGPRRGAPRFGLVIAQAALRPTMHDTTYPPSYLPPSSK